MLNTISISHRFWEIWRGSGVENKKIWFSWWFELSNLWIFYGVYSDSFLDFIKIHNFRFGDPLRKQKTKMKMILWHCANKRLKIWRKLKKKNESNINFEKWKPSLIHHVIQSEWIGCRDQQPIWRSSTHTWAWLFCRYEFAFRGSRSLLFSPHFSIIFRHVYFMYVCGFFHSDFIEMAYQCYSTVQSSSTDNRKRLYECGCVTRTR